MRIRAKPDTRSVRMWDMGTGNGHAPEVFATMLRVPGGDESEIVLRPRKWKMLGYLVICAIFMATGVAAIRTDGAVIGWMCLFFFGWVPWFS